MGLKQNNASTADRWANSAKVTLFEQDTGKGGAVKIWTTRFVVSAGRIGAKHRREEARIQRQPTTYLGRRLLLPTYLDEGCKASLFG